MNHRTNTNLSRAKSEKDDEFFTPLDVVENELCHYREQLRGKIIYCNCDNVFRSNFFIYFAREFATLGIKSLICTNYIQDGGGTCFWNQNNLPNNMAQYQNRACKIVINEKIPDLDKDGYVTRNDVELFFKADMESKNPKCISYLTENGDFRSTECKEILSQSDVVITNPPFSLFREYISLLESYKKQYLIIGNKNAYKYKEIFPLIKHNKMWWGYSIPGGFIRPDSMQPKSNDGLARWYTNLDVSKRHTELFLKEVFCTDRFLQYDNYNAININKVQDIPRDFNGIMGVPITFLDNYNPDQFEILWVTDRGGDGYLDFLRKPYTTYNTPYISGKATYARIFIQNKKPVKIE